MIKYKSKLVYMYKRHWGGYITPTEACELISIGALTSKNYSCFAFERKKNGLGSFWFYFDVKKHSKLESYLMPLGR